MSHMANETNGMDGEIKRQKHITMQSISLQAFTSHISCRKFISTIMFFRRLHFIQTAHISTYTMPWIHFHFAFTRLAFYTRCALHRIIFRLFLAIIFPFMFFQCSHFTNGRSCFVFLCKNGKGDCLS